MKPLHDIYKASFFKRRDSLLWRVPLVCDGIIRSFPFASVIDVGCAIGDFVKGFLDRGKDAHGIEGSQTCVPYMKIGLNRLFIADLRYPIHFMITFDLVLCLEVAEHIELEHSSQFVDNLTQFGDNILISMAPPGQGGHYHVNCQEIEYWDDKFAVFGFARQDHIADKVKVEWEPYKKTKGMNAYYGNLHFYKRIDSCLM